MTSLKDTSKFSEYKYKFEGAEKTIKFTPVKNLFGDVEAPYLVVGQTTNGKTTFCADIINKYGPTATMIYYVTNTKQEIGYDVMQSIPKVCIKQPTYENLKAIWETIKMNNQKMNITIEELRILMSKIYDEKTNKIINDEYSKFYKSEYDKIYSKVKSHPQAKDEMDVICLEILTKLILNGINQFGVSKLSDDDLVVIQSLVSTKQKTILLIDDVSAQLQELETTKGTVEVVRETGTIDKVRKAEAYKQLLTDIFTTGRRFNAIIGLFVHDWNIIKQKSLIKNFIICDETSMDMIASLRTVGNQRIKAQAKLIAGEVFKYKYNFIVIKDNDLTVTKADLIDDLPKLDKLCQHYVDTCKNISQNLDYLATPKDKSVNIDLQLQNMI